MTKLQNRDNTKKDLMVFLLKGLGNENEGMRMKPMFTWQNVIWGIRIKCVGLTQFENKKCESHSHRRVRNGNKTHVYFYISLIFSYFLNYSRSNRN